MTIIKPGKLISKNTIIMAAGHHHLFHLIAPTMAREHGWFEEEGLTDYEYFATGTDERTLFEMGLGQIQFGLDPKPTTVIDQFIKGQRVFIIGGWLNKPPFSYVGAKGIKSIEDLRGKKIGGREWGGIDTQHMKNHLRSHGIDPDKDVEVVVTGFPCRTMQKPLLDSGQIQAGAVLNSEVAGMVAEGYPLLADLPALYPYGYPQRVIVTTEEVLQNRSHLIKPFLKGLIRGFRMMNQDYYKTMEIVDQVVKRGELRWDTDMDFDLWKTKYPFFEAIPADGMVTMQGLETVVREERAAGKIPDSFRMDDILRLEFVKEAAKEIDAKFGQGYK